MRTLHALPPSRTRPGNWSDSATDGLTAEWVEEPAPGYPKRPAARDEAAAKGLRGLTLTNLYNARPRWLTDAHATLDAAVAGAYGWDTGISEEDALRNLLALNAARGT